MSAGSVGVLGFDDDQQQHAWDAAQLWWSLPGPVTGPQVTPVMDCSRFQNIFTFSNLSGGQYRLNLKWWEDAAGTQGMGTRSVDMDPSYTGTLRLWTVSNGPYVQGFTFPASPSTPYTPDIRSLLTNKQLFLPATPDAASLLTTGIAMAGGASKTYYPYDYYSGTVGVYIEGGTQGLTWTFNYLGDPFLWLPFWDGSVAANTSYYATVTWPLHAVQCVFTNASGALANSGGQVTLICNYAAR